MILKLGRSLKKIPGTCPNSFTSFVIVLNIQNLNFNAMQEFILIFRHQDGQKVASPEQLQSWMKQTMDWIGGIAAQNKFVSGTGLLFDDAKVVNHSKMVTNGPYGEIKETIGGFV